VTAFQQMLADLRQHMVTESIGEGETFALRKVPANNTAPSSAMVGIFDGKGGAVTMVITVQGLVKLELGIQAILNEGQS
jgi:hypothetical protein